VDEHLGVTARVQAMATRLERPAQFEVIVDLAVEDHADRPVFVPDRLAAPFEIHDRKPPHPHGHPARGHMHPLAVRPAMRGPIEHLVQAHAGLGFSERWMDEAGDAAHGMESGNSGWGGERTVCQRQD